MHRLAKPAYLSQFPFYALLGVAPYCVPGGIGVVSREAHRFFTMVLARSTHAECVQQHLAEHTSIQLTLDRYSHWMPTMDKHTPRAPWMRRSRRPTAKTCLRMRKAHAKGKFASVSGQQAVLLVEPKQAAMGRPTDRSVALYEAQRSLHIPGAE